MCDIKLNKDGIGFTATLPLCEPPLEGEMVPLAQRRTLRARKIAENYMYWPMWEYYFDNHIDWLVITKVT